MIHINKYYKYLFAILLLVVNHPIFCQSNFSRIVISNDKEPLIGASVQALKSKAGTITNVEGHFSISVLPEDTLVVSYIGYQPVTLTALDKLGPYITLTESEELLSEVVVKAETSFFDKVQPIHNEVILESELLKSACCNLSESFETNASIDVSFNDPVSGAKQIRLLGLAGRYVQINRESIPLVRGLTGRYGLSYVPGTWIQSIDIGKGAGSVVHGFESMAGQINIGYKRPESSEKLYLNAYANSFGRVELNLNHATQLNDHWTAGILIHGDYFDNEIDRNDDEFVDLPKSRQVNALTQFVYEKENVEIETGFQVLQDQKAGGQKGVDFGDNHLTSDFYGFSNETTRLELFGKAAIFYPGQPYRSLGFLYSASYQDISGGFGRNLYEGEEKTLYSNIIYRNIFGNTNHPYKTGASLLVDDFQESYQDSLFSRREVVPGFFFEYSWLPTQQFSLVLGQRVDFHNLYGTYYTPRVHARFQWKEGLILRAAGGRGYRTPNVLTENTRVLVSSRRLSIPEEIDPEISWNFGGSILSEWPLGDRKLQWVVDYFYTFFENQLIVDQDAQESEILFSNLDGRSFAHSLQIEGSIRWNSFFTSKAAYKYYNVQTTLANRQQRAPFVPRHRFFINFAYATKFDKWKADATVHWSSRQRLPDTQDNPVEFRQRSFSPSFALVNAQVSRGFKWGNIYIGAENLLDFRQDDPIIDPENPFGDQFDGSLAWGPIAGRLIYTGIRYKIK